jgi:hypothetical protein
MRDQIYKKRENTKVLGRPSFDEFDTGVNLLWTL